MSDRPGEAFHETQRLPMRRTALAVAIPPLAMLALLIWQVVLGHTWGQKPMSNGNVIGWTIFLGLVYIRLITVRLVTDVDTRGLTVRMRGLWRARRVRPGEIASVETMTIDPARDFGGYGIRSRGDATAYLAGSPQAVRVGLINGSALVIGSARAEDLKSAIQRLAAKPKRQPDA